uniref:Uncharacterized protein n=1 Tax=Rangifer tarandus platyrhynchus TaxID=3082113 RepID=A0ACB0EHX5_RANTA|nr:unnamed protein product [Rangifer tarandus platyrhynchus]
MNKSSKLSDQGHTLTSGRQAGCSGAQPSRRCPQQAPLRGPPRGGESCLASRLRLRPRCGNAARLRGSRLRPPPRPGALATAAARLRYPQSLQLLGLSLESACLSLCSLGVFCDWAHLLWGFGGPGDGTTSCPWPPPPPPPMSWPLGLSPDVPEDGPP